jgi:antitoxin PrlF
MKTTVSEKGQMTIPKPLRLRLGIRPGQVLEIEEQSGHLVVTKSFSGDPVDAAFGILNLGCSTDEALALLRREPETE